MLYAHKKHLVSVVRLNEEITLQTIDSFMYGHPGEYLITDQFGNKTIITERTFKVFFEPVEKVDVKEDLMRGYIEMGHINSEEAEAGRHTYTEGLFTDKPL